MNPGKKVIAFFGHHKGGTTWTCSIFHSVVKLIGLKDANYWHTQVFDYDLRRALLRDRIEAFSYTACDYKFVSEFINHIKGFHIVRDPRDICVSAYYSHLYSHPTDVYPKIMEYRKKLKKLSKDDGLLLEMEILREEFGQMYSWNYSNPNVLEIKMEDISKSPYEMFLEIFDFLGLCHEEFASFQNGKRLNPNSINQTGLLCLKNIRNRILRRKRRLDNKIYPENLFEIIFNSQFSKLSGGRKPGEEDNKSHYRKGVHGDWVNHFNKGHIRQFKENYNGLLMKLGYENEGDWEKKYKILGDL